MQLPGRISRKFPLYAIAITSLLLCTHALQAAAPLDELIRKELEDSLYPIESVMPDYTRPLDTPPKFAVAEFRTSNDNLIPWSQAIAEILRYRTQYVPGVRLIMPNPQFMKIDAQIVSEAAQPLFTQHSDFQNLFRTIGTESVLTGSIEQSGSTYTLVTELIDSANGAIMSQMQWQFDTTQLPDTIIAIVEWVYKTLGVPLSAEELVYVQDLQSLDVLAINDFVSSYVDLQVAASPDLLSRINELRTIHPRFLLFSVYSLLNKTNATNLKEAYENQAMIKDLIFLNSKNAGLQLEAYRVSDMGMLPEHEVSELFDQISSLASRYPHDANTLSFYSDALVHFGRTDESIAVLLEATERWPDNYRLWWSLGWALNQHAWQVRGNSMWQDVPERAKDKFQALVQLSLDSIDKAMELNDRSAELWVLKLNALGGQSGFSDELINVFNSAAELVPTHYPLYETALHFSGDQWSGTAVARKHIIEVAEKNNPTANWTQAMRQYHAADFNAAQESTDPEGVSSTLGRLLGRPEKWLVGILLTALALWIAFVLGRKSAD